MANTDNIMTIEVAYALPDTQTLLVVDVPEGTTLIDAIMHSGIMEKHPEIDLNSAKTGIFGKMAKADAVLRAKDRVEIYRPLIAEPKESRRQQAEMQKAKKAAQG